MQDGVWERGKAAGTERVSLAKLPTFDLRITVSHNNYSKAKASLLRKIELVTSQTGRKSLNQSSNRRVRH